MFEEIFFPRTAERYRAAPLVEQRERYLVHLKETGARRPTLRKCANDQLSLVRLLDLKEGDRVRRFPDRGRGRDLVAAERTQVRPAGIAQGEKRASSTTRSDGCAFLGWLDEADEVRHPPWRRGRGL